MSMRLKSALGLSAVLMLGLVAAFVPFYLGSRSMQRFCTSLSLGGTAAEVRAQADRAGYDVSYESLFSKTESDSDGGIDGGVDPALDAGVPKVVGGAFASDPQFFRPRCVLRFDADGHLSSRTFTDG